MLQQNYPCMQLNSGMKLNHLRVLVSNKGISGQRNIKFLVWRIFTFLPGLTSLNATSAAVFAAAITSACLPVTGPSLRTWVCATTAMKPSMWHPISLQSNESTSLSSRSSTISPLTIHTHNTYDTLKGTYIFKISPSSNTVSSLASGEKWQTVLFTEIHVGNATPLSIFFLTFLYILPDCLYSSDMQHYLRQKKYQLL